MWRPVGHCGLPQVLDTYMFHSFLKARLSRRMDAFAQMELSTQSEEDRCAAGGRFGSLTGPTQHFVMSCVSGSSPSIYLGSL